ncbi:MAG: RluA family pseudouridine synthase [Thermoguttaceae bacterium]
MIAPDLQVLYEDNHLLALVKPAGIPTMGAPAGKPSLLSLARQYIKRRYRKPGKVYLGVVSRLDAPVSGVVLFARTSKAARRLAEQFRTRAVKKTYWALVEGVVPPGGGRCADWIGRDERRKRMRLVEPAAPGAQQARLSYRRLKRFRGFSLLEVKPQTGRKHQIRLQLARRGWPILGDNRYGSRHPFSAGIALHARRLAVLHPVKGELIELTAPLPESWGALGIRG